jgi:hypothetical protein
MHFYPWQTMGGRLDLILQAFFSGVSGRAAAWDALIQADRVRCAWAAMI